MMRSLPTNLKKHVYKAYCAAAASTFAAILALILASISFAISGLSCKIVLTESRPWPNLFPS